MIEYIGIDIGGTNIRVGAMDENENIVHLKKDSTSKNVENAEELYAKILRMINDIEGYKEAKEIGIGFPGAIRDNRIDTSRNIPYFKGYPLADRLKKDTNIDVIIQNDAKVAALGEAIKGAGVNEDIVCYVTVSTGLGGAVVMNKKIYLGANGVGGYFSRMVLDGKNISEHLISSTALLNKAKNNGLNVKNTEELFSLSAKSNLAQEIIKEFKINLTNLLLNISITINPNIIILGGGVMNSKEYFLDEVIENFRSSAHSFAKDTKIVTSKLEEPGVIGALMYAKSNYIEK